jgi:predicted RNase H-like nuclease (RuvC/YqgF family)
MPRMKPPSSMPPKISPTPRKNCEMGEQVELSKMMTKRQRIQHELQMMKQRMELLNSQLSLLDSQIEAKEQAIQELRQSSGKGVAAISGEIKPIQDRSLRSQTPLSEPIHRGNSNQFKTFHLEY